MRPLRDGEVQYSPVVVQGLEQSDLSAYILYSVSVCYIINKATTK